MLFTFVEQHFNIPAYLVAFKGVFERHFHVCCYHNLVHTASAIADNEQLDRYAFVLSFYSGIDALVLTTRLETYAFLLLYEHICRDSLAIYSKASTFISEKCNDMYGAILDAPDFLYEVLTEEPFVNKKILGN